jgi:peroxiredoxin
MLRQSRIMALGTPAPDFSLPDTEGRDSNLAALRGENGLLVAFICNHCPFVLHLINHFFGSAAAWQEQGLGVVANSSNDPSDYPGDAVEFMPAFARGRDFTFPYLHDGDQRVALAYEAIGMPDFFLFDGELKLFYAGQYDSSCPKINRPPVSGLPPLRTDLPVTGDDLHHAAAASLAGSAPPEVQRPSAGCSITRKAEDEPSWA